MSLPPNGPSAVLPPTMTAAELTQLASTRPDLGAAVASHPNAHPELVAWLAQHGAPEARAAAARRLAGPAPAAPGAAGRGPAPAAPGAPDAPSPASPAPAPGTAASAPGTPAPAPAPGTPAPGTPAPAPARKRRRGLLIGAIAAGTVIVLGGGGAIAWSLFAPRGAATPTGAVEKLVDVVTGDNLLGALSLIAPSEAEVFSGIAESAAGIRFGDIAYDDYLADAYAAISIDAEDLVYDETTIAEGVARVGIVDGSPTIDADVEALADVLEAFARAHAETFAEYSGMDPDQIEAELERGRADLVAGIDDAFPVSIDFADEVDADGITPAQALVVDEGGWYLSPLLTLADGGLTGFAGAQRDDVIGDAVIDAVPSASAEAALDDAIAGFNAWQSTGEMEPFVERLPLAERRLLSLYGRGLSLDLPSGYEVTDHRETWVPGSGDAVFAIDAVSLAQHGLDVGSYEDGCVTARDARPSCLDELPFAAELGLDTPVGIVSEVDGGWQFSPLATLGRAIERALDGFAAAAEDGDLSELMEP
ncbi:hypothetical protein [Microbacterium sediminis]|uniref:Leucine rich repeat variant domain-containing protein n=1 Tax=Microbacterium sediminis TaxID=904291 RepID=A0A1B9NDV2_9MICO|nr:hypothetical protein [Microbacterium sediminis]OCG74785.1 hypothetical protein A7J15_04500 [Microbacterium sediminis]